MTSRITPYREQSRKYLRQAYQELAVQDFCQASEKGWGAASQMVKAAAEVHDWEHKAHWQLQQAIEWLAEEMDDKDVSDSFAFASALHINFYEGWLAATTIESYLSHVTRLIDKLEAVLPAEAS